MVLGKVLKKEQLLGPESRDKLEDNYIRHLNYRYNIDLILCEININELFFCITTTSYFLLFYGATASLSRVKTNIVPLFPLCNMEGKKREKGELDIIICIIT